MPQRVSGKEPMATISKDGLMSFNVSCTVKYLKEANYAKLYYDKETKHIGIKLFGEQVVNSVKLVKNKGRENHVSVFMQSLLKEHGWYPLNQPLRGIPCKMDEKLDMLLFNLSGF